MPVSSETSIAGPYYPNGVTRDFAFDFKAASTGEVVAADADGNIISRALYSVTLDDDEGGTLHFDVAPSGGAYPVIYVMSEPALTQPSDFDNAGPSFNPAALTRAIDRAAIRDLKLHRDIGRALKLPFGEAEVTFPGVADRANRFLSFLPNGDVMMASGTGADAGLRQDIASSTGGEMVGLQRPGGIARNVGGALLETWRVTDFMTAAEAADVIAGTGSLDVTAAIQTAIDTIFAGGGGKLVFPKGLCKITDTLVIDPPSSSVGIILEGSGRNSVIRQTGAGKDIIRWSDTQYLFNSGIRDMHLQSSAGAGHCIVVGRGISTNFFDNLELDQQNAGKHLFYADFSAAGGIYDTRFSGGSWYCSSSSTVAGFRIICGATRFNENIFENLRCYNAKTEQFFKITGDSGSSFWLINNSWRNINFEVCMGGGFYVSNFKLCSFRNISFWDAQGAYAANLIEMVAGTGYESAANSFENVGRHGGTLDTGIQDIKISSGQDTDIRNCYTQAADAPRYDFGNKRVTVTGSFVGTITNGNGMRSFSNGNGMLKFPNTVNGTYLNYYDEGTWTASIGGSGGNPTTPVTVTGQWTRIGRIVHLSAEFSNVDTTGASGSVVVSGLPFAGNATYRGLGSVAMTGFGTTPATARVVGPLIFLVQATSRATEITHANGSGPGAGHYLSVSLSYIV